MAYRLWERILAINKALRLDMSGDDLIMAIEQNDTKLKVFDII